MLKLTRDVLEEIKEGQMLDLRLIEQLALINQGKGIYFKVEENLIIRFLDKVWVLDFPELKKRIMEEGHMSSLNIHLGALKMCQDLKRMFWCLGMKKEVAKFVYSCLICQKIKIEHQKSYGLMKPLSIHEWKWDNISMDCSGIS